MQKQRAHLTQFLSFVSGDPVTYSGGEVDAVHASVDIRPEHFGAIAELLEEPMIDFDVDPDDRHNVRNAFTQYEDAVVQC